MSIHRQPDAHTIADAAIFVHCSRRQREHLQTLSSIVEVKAGYQLTKQGQTGLEFGVIVDGTAEVTVGGRRVATLGPGDHYGEVALLERVGHPDHAVRMATVTASTDMRVAVMSVTEFATVLVEFPDVADAIKRAARDRVGAVSSTLSSTTLSSTTLSSTTLSSTTLTSSSAHGS